MFIMFWKKTVCSVDTDRLRVDELLERSVEEVIGRDSLRKQLLSGKQLRVKLGIDPTSPDLHLGRAVVLNKLRDFQNLGHKIIFIVGDSTGVIGDTSDKESERPMLTKKEVKENAKSYFTQAAHILNMHTVETLYNSSWLNSLSYDEIGDHADQFSVADFIARDNIKRRLVAGKRVSLREVLYPLMQGYDSVAVRADVEIGGTDQRFNLLAGRTLQEHFGQKPQNIVMMGLIEGLDGRKMSSSWGNVIKLTDSPSDMFGKIMSLSDDLMKKYFIYLTRVPVDKVDLLLGGHPRDTKIFLAHKIVSVYYDEKMADKAKDSFIKTFQKKEIPSDVKSVEVLPGTALVEALLVGGTVSSKTEFRRLIKDGAISYIESGEREKNERSVVESTQTVKVGKHRFLNIMIKNKQ